MADHFVRRQSDEFERNRLRVRRFRKNVFVRFLQSNLFQSVRLYDHRKLSSDVSSLRGLVSCFVLENRKQNRRSRVTSVVFNSFGNEILVSYSSKSIYLLDAKRTLSHDQSRNQLTEHQTETAEAKGSTPKVKRLRLGGDWSDTGPDARPTNEPTAAEGGARNMQNFFMQRMSDILTQLVSGTNSEPNETTEENETSPPIAETTENVGLFELNEDEDEEDEDESSADEEETDVSSRLSSPSAARRTFRTSTRTPSVRSTGVDAEPRRSAKANG